MQAPAVTAVEQVSGSVVKSQRGQVQTEQLTGSGSDDVMKSFLEYLTGKIEKNGEDLRA